jgi:hypothetical protein
MVTLDPPVFVTFSDRDWLFPTVTLPKLRLVGVDPSAPAARPIPESGIVRVGLDAFEVIVMPPVAAPVVVGVKVTLKVVLCPADKIRGAAIPLTVNPVPPIAT